VNLAILTIHQKLGWYGLGNVYTRLEIRELEIPIFVKILCTKILWFGKRYGFRFILFQVIYHGKIPLL